MENYFNYFTEIEEHFQRRRGSIQILSTLDWALIETWKDAGVPLEAVLRGIDATFEAYDRRPSKTRKINSLAYCTQEVLAASEQMAEAAVGATRAPSRETGFETEEIAAFLARNAEKLQAIGRPASAQALATETASNLRQLAEQCRSGPALKTEDLERRLTVMEEKLFAGLLAATSDDALLSVRTETDRDLAPYRRGMTAAQIEQLHKQYVRKRLLEQYGIPRLSLFYL